jgi:hypothetical protein
VVVVTLTRACGRLEPDRDKAKIAPLPVTTSAAATTAMTRVRGHVRRIGFTPVVHDDGRPRRSRVIRIDVVIGLPQEGARWLRPAPGVVGQPMIAVASLMAIMITATMR